MVWERNIARKRARNVVSPANFLDWREHNRVFTEMAAFGPRRMTWTEGTPQRLSALAVTEGFFSLLGVGAEKDRVFSAAD